MSDVSIFRAFNEEAVIRLSTENDYAVMLNKYQKWIKDGKPGPEISEYLDKIDISREMEILKEAGYEDDAK